ncbi:MAG: DUF1003 domain-containing protein [Planctomycetales bacterium]|nr:DUF1003 domain-containing protein [Planctomycetales bacterium]
MTKHSTRKQTCQICHRDFAAVDVMPAALVRSPVVDRIQQDCPEWSAEGFICFSDLNHYRTLYVEHVLASERGELSALENQVVTSLHEQELLAENVNERFEQGLTFGARLADDLAAFGGSWTFLICFAALMTLWIGGNSLVALYRPFDPFPFILLNLILSCLAAIQAPVIMMSQNRQEAKDRVRAEHDFRVNLKAELEIRHLHAKLDLLLSHQWQRLLEIQEIQMELMQEARKGRGQR